MVAMALSQSQESKKSLEVFGDISTLWKDVGIFYYAQENAWNTKMISNIIVGGVNRMTRLQRRKVKYFLDNV